MGEVRVQVKLRNLIDEALADAGQLDPERVRMVTADAMIDTGAVRSVLPAHVVERLGLKPRRQQVVEYADGRKESVGMANGIIFNIMDREAEDDAYVLGDEVLIGQTVLEKMDLRVDCRQHCLVPKQYRQCRLDRPAEGAVSLVSVHGRS